MEGYSQPRDLCRGRIREFISRLILLLPFALQFPAGASHWPKPTQVERLGAQAGSTYRPASRVRRVGGVWPGAEGKVEDPAQ